MDNSNKSKLNQSVLVITAGFILLFPLLYFPFINDQFQVTKTWFTVATAILLVLTYTIASLNRKKLDINIKTSFIPVAIFSASYIASTFFQSNNLIQALSERTILVVSLTIIYFICSSVLSKHHLNTLLYSLILSTSLSVVFKLFNFSKILWSTTGSPTSLLAIIALSVAIGIGLIIKKGHLTTKFILIPFITVNLLVALYIVVKLFFGQIGFVNLPYSMGYQVAIDILKHPRSAVLGVGPDNFLPAFTILKPKAYNEIPNMWTLRPAYSSNELFHTMTINGILGTTGLVLIFLFLIKNTISKWKTEPEIASANLITIITLLLLPANTTLLGILFFVLIFNSLSEYNKPTITVRSNLASLFVGISLIIIGIYSLVLLTNRAVANYYFTKAKPGSNERFQLIKKAQIKDPTNSSYFVSYANLSIDLAEAISKKNNDQVTPDDRKIIKDLIEQAIPNINHAAYKLNQENPNVWEARARIMRRISSIVPAALQESIKSYNFAIALDSKNPVLHMEFGQFLQSLKLYAAAQREYETAATLKSKYPNPIFNLAILYYEQKDYKTAETMIKQALTLVPQSDTENYTKITDLQNRIQEQLQTQKIPTATAPSNIPAPVLTSPDQLKPGSIDASSSTEINVQQGQEPVPQANTPLPFPSVTPPINIPTITNQ